ncbi:MAG: hypothetical protein HY282_16640 [Nitrospirae bacterium]|nr:hypothetical protein [Candidatus Manganitrophaceae bacterium]
MKKTGLTPKTLFKPFLSLLLLAALISPAPAELYSWKDGEGVLNATNDRGNVPPGVRPDVLKEPPSPAAPKTPAPPPAPTAPLPESPTPAAAPEETRVMQGTFAVQLAAELGLGDSLSPEEAADLLTQRRITPALGRWSLEAPITPELVSRLRLLAVSAAQRGALSVQPEEALLAFDTTAALLGVAIPIRSDPALTNVPSTSPVLDAPPLILIAPPPEPYFSSYLWVPVDQGFFWNGVSWNGFFVFNQPVHFHGRRFGFHDHFIEHRFTDHLRQDRFIQDRFMNDRRFGLPPFYERRPVPLPPQPFVLDHPGRRLHGAPSARPFSAGRPTVQPRSSFGVTPLAPPSGPAISPMAPPLSQATPHTPSSLAPAGASRRSLRGR